MFWAAFLPIIRSSWPYIGFGTFYAVVMNLLLPGIGWSSILLYKIYSIRYSYCEMLQTDAQDTRNKKN